jgi:protein tyrosine/serine phosphatase
LVALATVKIVYHYRDDPVHHFGVVVEGVLYRSGQPDRTGWEKIYRRCRFRTVADLRGPEATEPWSVAEEDFCRARSIQRVHIPVDSISVMDRQVDAFLRLVADPARRPVLVHCAQGSVRTGVMVAAYRIVVQGWSYSRAIDEAKSFHFDPAKYKEYDGFLRDLASRPAAPPERHGKPADPGR